MGGPLHPIVCREQTGVGMPERPLLILPAPGEPQSRAKKRGGGNRPHVPDRDRQAERLGPRFAALQQAVPRLRTAAAGLAPEQVVVLETAGPVEDFIVAVRRIEGLEWLGELEDEDIPPDDDFFVVDKGGARTDKTLRGRIFLVFTNQRALQQIFSLWGEWKDGNDLSYGLAKWGDLFSQLRDVRPWGVRDRLIETGVLQDWSERVAHNEEVVPCEIELWYRDDAERRRTARDRVVGLVHVLGGQVVQEATIDDIAYHALLVRLPVASIQPLLQEAGRDTELIHCENIQFFRASGQMAGVIVEDARIEDPQPVDAAGRLNDPVVALLDGLPLQNHRRLAGRLIVDDPDGYEAGYPANERRHGTAMASLILHGDIDAGIAPLPRRLYVRPIIRPDAHGWRAPRDEVVSERTLIVDLLHRAVRRILEGEGGQPAVAPSVCVINLSIGIRDRLFDGALSPLARLLDWLAWKYRVLFIVSAGNHSHDIELSVPKEQLAGLSAHDLEAAIIRAIAADSRNRRLLSPAESVNALTIGALHDDASGGEPPPNTMLPYLGRDLPSIVNAQGMGYRRAIKPDVLLPGGRVVVAESVQPTENAHLQVHRYSRAPGQRVAAPGPNPGDLNFTWHVRGTSNATALATRAAAELYDVLEELRAGPGGDLIGLVPRSVWLKALLVHGAAWGLAGEALAAVLRSRENSRRFKEYVTRLLGYGAIDVSRVREGSPYRATALSAGHLQADQAHIHRFPLPPSLSGRTGWRRLTVTLAWLTPVNTFHQAWRRADLWFSPPAVPLPLARQEADWHAVQRGTVQHEVLVGDRAAAFVDGTNLDILVSCRADAGALEEPVAYALATTLEVADSIGVPIYDEIRARVHARVQVVPGG
jgi:hypothetical protein